MHIIHQESFKIRSFEINRQGYANIQTIGNFLQECAGNHAAHLGISVKTLFKRNLTWILSRLHLQMETYPKWGETITIETWPSQALDKFALRDFLIFNAKETVIGRATTSWMLLDLLNFRPISMPDFILEIQRPDRERALRSDFPKLPEPQQIDIEKFFNVRFSDLDVNQHVNNVRYLEWAAETIPIDIWEKSKITEMEISFRSETNFGDRVRVSGQQKNSEFIHAIHAQKSNREVARIRSIWRNI